MTPQSKLALRWRSLVLVAAGAALLGSVPVQAQRDPAYQAARQTGQVGEQPDGYLGHVTPPTPEVRALVLDINIKRKDAYTKSAAANGSTVEQFAFTTGCNLIARTLPGEKYKSPDGRWLTRDSSPPERDSRCL